MHPHEHAPDADRSARTARAPMPAPASAATPAAGLSPHSILALQRSAGNAAVVQMLRQAGHPWAQEQHQHGANCGHQQPAVQRSAVHDVLRGGGQPLDGATRTDMESRLGADFSDVRIHNDSAARASAAEVGARAYTSGSHVVIGNGGNDKHTLAHELTHVIQQRQGPVAGTDNGTGLRVSDPSDRFERAAEANATRVLSGPAPLQRAEWASSQTPSANAKDVAVQRMPNHKRKSGGNHRSTPYGRSNQQSSSLSNEITQVTPNEYAQIRNYGDGPKYEQVLNPGDRNSMTAPGKVKDYVVTWLNDDTFVIGIKDRLSPYAVNGHRKPAYGGGYPALAGGTSDASLSEMEGIRAANQPNGMSMHTLDKEVNEELLGEYELDLTINPPTQVGRHRYVSEEYRTWEGWVTKVPAERRTPRPNDGAHQENTATREIKLSGLRGEGITSESDEKDVLRAVAALAGTPIPDRGDRQADTYLNESNHPLQDLAVRIKHWIRELEKLE